MNNFILINILNGNKINCKTCVDINFPGTFMLPSIMIPPSDLSNVHGGFEGNNYSY